MFKFVRSHYRARWIGIVLDRRHRTGNSDLYTVLIVEDSSGNPPIRKMIKTIDSAWTISITPFNISHINKDWLTI
jgi:hypothetical protein